MIGVKVLVENTSTGKNFKAKHGLSIFINNGLRNILLDTGPDKTFIKNAPGMNVDLSSAEYLVLSHPHIDHTGGLNYFNKINTKAEIVIFDNPDNRYYTKIFKFFKFPIGMKINRSVRQRIKMIEKAFQIDERTWFIKNSVNTHQKSSLNDALFRKVSKSIIPDDFTHEGILVIRDIDELVIFNSCTHNGVMNTIESVREMFPELKIRSYVGGFHLCNPVTGKNETEENLTTLVNDLMKTDITFYTGHCTGEHSFNFFQEHLRDRIKRISTGMDLSV